MKKYLLFVVLFIFIPVIATTGEFDYKSKIRKGIKYNFDETGDNFAKFSAASQTWLRYSELNPGVTDGAGKVLESDFDILLRRNYFNVFAKINRFTFFTMFCMSSQPSNVSVNPGAGKKQSFYLYDSYLSYALLPGYLQVGAGLNMYGGASRYYSASSGATLGTDVPLVTAPSLLTSDQAARRLNVFATGMPGSLIYSASIYKPFIPSEFNPLAAPGSGTAGDYRNYNLGGNARVELQLLDKEPPTAIPFKSATYAGEKRVFNIGVGIDYLPEATYSIAGNAGEKEFHDKLHLAADVFFDYPLRNSAALTLYGAYLLTDYGPNYLQHFGVQDIWGGGISEPQLGTGTVIYGQAAYAFPAFDDLSRIQLFTTGTVKQFDALSENMPNFSAGVNYFVIGHKLKFTVEYLLRPYTVEGIIDSYKSMVIGKFQVAI